MRYLLLVVAVWSLRYIPYSATSFSSPEMPHNIETRLSIGERVPLKEIPLDLLEEIKGVPKSTSMALYLKHDSLCYEESEIESLIKIKGIGEKRAEKLLEYIQIRKC